jgi:carbamoyltransferase
MSVRIFGVSAFYHDSASALVEDGRVVPEDAFRCFMGTAIEVLVVNNCFLRKDARDSATTLDYKTAFDRD